ncbi:MAG TPA: DUF4345 family protein [Cyclobacteriaceae bacterium]|nr:DUF4345 family protein [Cyclobacteriaceae bacterium]
MAFLNYFFFYTYIGLVLLAGFWGAFLAPHLDFGYLFALDLHSLEEQAKVNLLSQYRFLRALELGYGLFAIVFLKEIFSVKRFNLLFLSIMGLGILARIASWFVDGTPSGLFIFFLSYEALGWCIILLYCTKKGLYHVA